MLGTHHREPPRSRAFAVQVGKKSIYRSGIMGPVDCFGKILQTEGFFGPLASLTLLLLV